MVFRPRQLFLDEYQENVEFESAHQAILCGSAGIIFATSCEIREIYLPKRVLAIEYRFPGSQDPARSGP